ncbi:comm domain-containing protein 4 [Plakobranchus ocellatus]|uniref:Comm domain-containing protein 4 n=1 Tax=Plakobranchus ocellatus TaxID=259542 RepID=A0AAV3ZS87_9GAST|nr:comm domain-containing protein 4 [Plakobranchus ocellatus]
MRFRFCGDLDCPDWVLAEINILSKITSVKAKLLGVQVLKNMLGDAMDYEKVHKLTSDAKFETGDIKASIAALSFILSSAAKYDVDADTLSNELQQLGLPKEHTTSLCKSYSDAQGKLQEIFRNTSLRVSGLESVQWRVDYVLSSSQLQEVNEPSVQLKLDIKDGSNEETKPVAFTLTSEKFRVLLHELKQAQTVLENLEL